MSKNTSESGDFEHKASCESYVSSSDIPQASSSGIDVVQREEFKMDMKPSTSNSHPITQSPSRLRKLSSGWKSLKRRLSADTSNRHDLESFAHAFRSTEILPDDLEYIEGGDIFHDNLPHHEEVSEEPSASSQTSSNHILTTVAEEQTTVEEYNSNENNATDGDTNTNSSAKNASINLPGKAPKSPTRKFSGSKSTSKVSPLSDDTKF